MSIGLIVSLPNCNVSCWFLFGPLGVRASVVGCLLRSLNYGTFLYELFFCLPGFLLWCYISDSVLGRPYIVLAFGHQYSLFCCPLLMASILLCHLCEHGSFVSKN